MLFYNALLGEWFDELVTIEIDTCHRPAVDTRHITPGQGGRPHIECWVHCLRETRWLVTLDCEPGLSTPDSAIGGLLVLRPGPLTEPCSNDLFADHLAGHFKSYCIDFASCVRLVFVVVMMLFSFQRLGELWIYFSQPSTPLAMDTVHRHNYIPIKAECPHTGDEL